MDKKYFYIFLISLIIFLGLAVFFIIYLKQKSINARSFVAVEKFESLKLSKKTMNSAPIIGVKKFGNLKLGKKTISGQGEHTFAPHLKIPSAKFYVTGIQADDWCINEDCSLDGAFIQTMGGWLQMDTIGVDPELKGKAGLNLPENKDVKSMILIGDGDGKIVGIYPSRGLDDVIPILKLHQDLADFSILEGVESFRSFKVGEPAPLRHGDSISRFSDKLADFAERVPKNKNFYLYAIEKRKYDIVGMYKPTDNEYVCFISGCRYPNPDPPHDFLYAEIDELGGWFLANDMGNSEMVKLFGLVQEEVIAGKSSLVILTDEKGIIRAIHPNKTSSDALTILSQHPDLADVAGLYSQ